jgi:hypothetical protein
VSHEEEGIDLDLSPAELAQLRKAPTLDDGRVVCAFYERDNVDMTPAMWAALCAKRVELGRILTRKETLSVVKAKGAVDGQA